MAQVKKQIQKRKAKARITPRNLNTKRHNLKSNKKGGHNTPQSETDKSTLFDNGAESEDSISQTDKAERTEPGKWKLTQEVLIRVHHRSKRKLLTPSKDQSDPCPLPVRFWTECEPQIQAWTPY